MEFEVLGGNGDARKLDPRGIQWPDGTLAVIGKDEHGQVQAFSAIITLPHIEGTWVAEAFRRGMTPARLVKKVEEVLAGAGGSFVWAFAHDADPQIKSYLERFGYQRLPFSVYMKELKCQ